MVIYRAADYASMSRKAANIISAQVIMKPDCVTWACNRVLHRRYL